MTYIRDLTVVRWITYLEALGQLNDTLNHDTLEMTRYRMPPFKIVSYANRKCIQQLKDACTLLSIFHMNQQTVNNYFLFTDNFHNGEICNNRVL